LQKSLPLAIDKKSFFAGEATARTNGTCHGAYWSGVRDELGQQAEELKGIFKTKNMLIYINSMIFCTIHGKTSFMGTTRKTITVTDQQDKWIKLQIAAGQFTNDSEYVRDLIRRDQASQADIEAIRAALIEGEESGESQLFDSGQFKQEMAAKHADKIR
jgi:antitoxin ParD1/3/4